MALSKSLWVNTGKDLAAAVADPEVDTIFLLQSMVLQDSDWQGYNTPLLVTRNITITSNSSADMPETWPVLDLAFVPRKFRLANSLWLKFSVIGVKGHRYFSHNISPGLDLLAPCLPGEEAVILYDGILIVHRMCYPAGLASVATSSNARPARFPGQQIVKTGMSQVGCIPDPAAELPLTSRCWALRGMLVDCAFSAGDFESNSQALVPNGYTVRIVNTSFFCPAVLSMDCIQQLGPVGCWVAWQSGKLPPNPSDPAGAPALAAHAGDEHQQNGGVSGQELGLILGLVLGGLVLAAVVVVAVVLVVRRRRRSQYLESPCVLGKLDQRASDSKADTDGHPEGAMVLVWSSDKDVKPGCSHDEAPKGLIEQGASDSYEVMDRSCFTNMCEGELHQRSTVESPPLRQPPLPVAAATPLPESQCQAFAVVSPLTPPREDVRLDVQPGNEVRLLSRVLGKGGFGKVVEGEYQGQRVAVKLLLEGTLEALGMAAVAAGVEAAAADPEANPNAQAGQEFLARGDGKGAAPQLKQEMIRSLAQEVEVLGRCHHPNVVRLLAACLTPPRMCLVMELMDTSLERMVFGRPEKLLAFDMVLDIALDVARGLEYLHPTVVHRDLKPANVLIKSTPESPRLIAKISDFGLSRLRCTVEPTVTPDAGTPEYMAPELFDVRNFVVTHKADIYSFGVLLWTMLTGKAPWKGERIVAMACRVSFRGERLPLDAIPAGRNPDKLIQLLTLCWEHEPERRPAAAEVVKRLLIVQEQLALKGLPLPQNAPGPAASPASP